MMEPPRILTLAFTDAAETFFDALRQQHFPADRNFLKAHLTLFHNLPHAPQIKADIEALCTTQAPLQLPVVKVASIGRGVAYKIESDVLQNLHKHLQQQWKQWLIPQDQHTLWPHITVQNKVAPQTATALAQTLAATFEPFEIKATGLRLWNYLNGPWELVETFAFKA